jgi:hypothetical protein
MHFNELQLLDVFRYLALRGIIVKEELDLGYSHAMVRDSELFSTVSAVFAYYF